MNATNAARIAFAVVAIAFFAAAHFYLYRRLIHDVTTRRWARLAAGGFIVALTLGGILGRLLWRGSTEVRPLAIAFPLWIGFFLYALLGLVAVEVALAAWRAAPKKSAPLPHSPERRLFLARTAAATAASVGAGLTGYGVFRAYHPAETTVVPIRLPGLPRSLDGFSIVQLTDVHIGSVLQRAFLDELVDRANAQKGDLVAITGDLVDGSPAQLGQYVARLDRLKSRYGTHFVTGNHDHWSGADAWTAALSGLGVKVLRNRHVSIGEGKDSFDLIGVDDWGGGGWTNGYDLEAAIAGRDPSRASVLLAHQPSGFDEAAKAGIGLQLSGHTHGGQMWPGPFVATLIWGSRCAGLTQVGSSSLYVSRGCGFVGPPLRVGSPPEIVKYLLQPA